jgi:hypothetical protein
LPIPHSSTWIAQHEEHALYESRPQLQDPNLLALAKPPFGLRSQVVLCGKYGSGEFYLSDLTIQMKKHLGVKQGYYL